MTRLIPARAGKTVSFSGSPSHAQAHPRAGGENVVTVPRQAGKSGSSPRGRGKQCRCRGWSFSARLIPARAGKTRRHARFHDRRWAHPRAGGENAYLTFLPAGANGSSPRGRGKPRVWRSVMRGVRLIPARAGKTPWWRRSKAVSPAHPRAGGENELLPSGGGGVPGSSPRGRGKRVVIAGDGEKLGLIPARAGKTKTSPPPGPVGTAHPRAGGENHWMPHPIEPSRGSSPRGRGKLLR